MKSNNIRLTFNTYKDFYENFYYDYTPGASFVVDINNGYLHYYSGQNSTTYLNLVSKNNFIKNRDKDFLKYFYANFFCAPGSSSTGSSYLYFNFNILDLKNRNNIGTLRILTYLYESSIKTLNMIISFKKYGSNYYDITSDALAISNFYSLSLYLYHLYKNKYRAQLNMGDYNIILNFDLPSSSYRLESLGYYPRFKLSEGGIYYNCNYSGKYCYIYEIFIKKYRNHNKNPLLFRRHPERMIFIKKSELIKKNIINQSYGKSV